MAFKVRLFWQDNEKATIQVGPFNSATPQVGDSINVPIGAVTVEAMVVGVYRTHHSEAIDVVDAYERPPTRPIH